jgi:TctA family transporter
MHTLQLLLAGFAEVFKPLDLLMMFIGLLIGMAVSIMPGLGLVMGVVLALPFTYGMALEPSIILLTAIYMSGTYAGCFTAILYRIPGRADGRAAALGRLCDDAARRGRQSAGLGAGRRADRRAILDCGDDHFGNAAK